jgi:hypothetical protein
MGADEQLEQFFHMLGSCLDQARVGGMPVRLALADGSKVEGVPTEPATSVGAEQDIDQTGTRRFVEVGDRVVALEHVQSYAVARPTPHLRVVSPLG